MFIDALPQDLGKDPQAHPPRPAARQGIAVDERAALTSAVSRFDSGFRFFT
jgi:hypothetical protein